MAVHRSIDDVGPVGSGPVAGERELRIAQTSLLGTGTMACPACDAPVAPAGRMTPAQPVGCPYCGHAARVRDFLSLGEPTRPARVDIRVVRP